MEKVDEKQCTDGIRGSSAITRIYVVFGV